MKKNKLSFGLHLLILLTISFISKSCANLPKINEKTMLDGTLIQDSSLMFPEKFLVSHQYPSPNDSLKNVPVVICLHGFSGSTPEWKEFRTFLRAHNAGMASLVLMGGHGRNYHAFMNSTWKDWQQPVLDEYLRLTNKGYTNISLAGASTGGTLILELLASDKLKQLPDPNQVFLVDPFIVPGRKALRYVDVLKYFVAYVESGINTYEEGSWYNYRPANALVELQRIVSISQENLKQGVTLPKDTQLSLYKSTKDEDADFKAVAVIKQGIKSPSKLRIMVVDSEKHVFTRLNMRNKVSKKDLDNRSKAFIDMLNQIKE